MITILDYGMGNLGSLVNMLNRIDVSVKIEKDPENILQSEKLILTDKMIEAYTTVGGIPHLDQAYTVFGEVIEGLDIIDKIAAEETNDHDRPLKDMTMKITIIQ